MAITEKDIHAIADQLLESGVNPTLAAIRKSLGGGSFTTISEAMKDWKAKQAEHEATSEIKEKAPERITERLQQLGGEVWAIAQDMANERLKSEREALEDVRAEYEENARQAAELSDDLAAELETANESIQALTIERDVLTSTNAELQSKSEQQTSKINELTILVEKLTTEAKALTDENKSISIELAQYKSRAFDLEKEKEIHVSKIDELIRLIGSLESERDSAINEHDKSLKKYHEQINADREKANNVIANLNSEIEKLTTKINTSEQELKRLLVKQVDDQAVLNKSLVEFVGKSEALQEMLDKSEREKSFAIRELDELKKKMQ